MESTIFFKKNENLGIESKLCFCALILYSLIFLINEYKILYFLRYSSWVTGDWLINYENGFVRRGLFGNFLLYLDDYLGVNAIDFLVFFRISVYVFIFLFFVLISFIKKINILDFCAFISPWSISFHIYWFSAGGRKEIVLFLCFFWFVFLLLIKNKIDPKKFEKIIFFYLLLAMPFLVLLHEGLFVFLHFFIVVVYFFEIFDNKKIFNIFILPFSISAIVFLFSFIYSGNEEYSVNICNSLIDRKYDGSICGGAIKALHEFDLNINKYTFITYALVFLMTFVFLLVYLISTEENSSKRRKKAIVVIASLLPTVPLYFVAMDWGRWLNISMLLIFISLLATKNYQCNWYKKNIYRKIFFLVFMYYYLFMWYFPHFVPVNNYQFMTRRYFDDWLYVWQKIY